MATTSSAASWSIGAGEGDHERVAGNGRAHRDRARSMSRSPSSASTSSCTTLISPSPRRCSHAGYENGCIVDIDWVDSEEINDETAGQAARRASTASSCRAASATRGIEGMICAANYARVHDIPYLRHLPRHADRGHRATPATCSATPTQTPASSTRTPRIRSST